MQVVVASVAVPRSLRRCRNSFRGYRLPDHMLNTFPRLKGAGAVDILALIIGLFGLFCQIATGAGVCTAAAERATHHDYSSSAALAFLRSVISTLSFVSAAGLLISL